MIEKWAKPRCFKGLHIDCLPVEYISKKNVGMTSVIMESWLMNGTKNCNAHEKILLAIDNCTAHTNITSLRKSNRISASKTTSVRQPLDTGIIKNLKFSLSFLEKIEENLLASSSSAKEVSASINLIQAVIFVAESWGGGGIKETTIQNWFTPCGFKQTSVDTLKKKPLMQMILC